jgi:hypothetical protein
VSLWRSNTFCVAFDRNLPYNGFTSIWTLRQGSIVKKSP